MERWLFTREKQVSSTVHVIGVSNGWKRKRCSVYFGMQHFFICPRSQHHSPSVLHPHLTVLAWIFSKLCYCWSGFAGSFWDPQSSQTLVLGTPTSPVTKMVPVGGKLWCGSQNRVLIINTTTLVQEVGGKNRWEGSRERLALQVRIWRL